MADNEQISRRVNNALYQLCFFGLSHINRKWPNNRVVNALSTWTQDVLLVVFGTERHTRQWFGVGIDTKKIYIIFAPQDTDKAVEISLYLEIEGYETFSEHKYRKSDSISMAAEEYFKNNSEQCSVFIAIISSAFAKSGYCQADLQAARARVRDGSAILVCFYIEDIEPPQGEIDVERVKLFGLSREQKRAAVLSAVRAVRTDDTLPEPIENISAPFSFGWKVSHKIGLVSGPENTPTFPFALSDADHQQRLEALRESALRLASDLQGHSHNVRSGYGVALQRYLSDLPSGVGSGNFLLADCEARTLRGMFEEDSAIH